MEKAVEIFLAEVLGTGILILLGDGVVAGVLLNRSKAQNAGWVVITFAWGFAVFAGVLTSLAVTDGVAHLNPAVTIGLAFLENGPEWSDVPQLIAGQFLGAMIGATLVWLAYLPHWKATPDPESKLAVFSTTPAIRQPVANLVSEIIGGFALVFALLAVISPGNLVPGSDLAKGFGPVLVGVIVMAIGLSLGGPTGYAINPARDLGPRIAHALFPIDGKGSSDWGYAWIPIVGPILGGVLGALVYQLVWK